MTGSDAPRAIVSFGQRSRTGKDTLAREVVSYALESYGHVWSYSRPRRWSWPLKNLAYQQYGGYGMLPPEFYEDPENEHLRTTVLPELGMTPVQVWIHLGDQMRKVHEGVFADQVPLAYPGELLVFSDMRRPYEAERAASFRKQGTVVWLVEVERPDAPAPLALDSSPLPFTHKIVNDGTLEDLRAKARKLVDALAFTVVHRSAPRGGA